MNHDTIVTCPIFHQQVNIPLAAGLESEGVKGGRSYQEGRK